MVLTTRVKKPKEYKGIQRGVEALSWWHTGYAARVYPQITRRVVFLNRTANSHMMVSALEHPTFTESYKRLSS